MRKTHLALLFISLCSLSFGQTFRFNQYTTEDGISQNFIYSINQDKRGYLWVGTGEGLCKFDGKHFVTFTSNDGLAENVITCSYMEDNGQQWFGHNEGGVTRFDSKEFHPIKSPKLVQSKINAISGYQGKIYGVSQNQGVFEIANGQIKLIGNFEKESFHAIQCLNEKNMLIGTSEGLIHLKYNGSKWEVANELLPETWVKDFSPTQIDGEYLMASHESGIAKVRLFEGEIQFSRWDSDYDISELQIQTIMEDANRNIWLGTFGNGLVKLHPDTLGNVDFEVTHYNTKTGMSSDFVQSVFQDREGNIWVGTFGAGLSTLIDDFFTFYSHDPEKYGESVSAIWVGGNEKWYGVGNGLIRNSPVIDSMWTFYDDSNGFVDDKVTSLFFNDSILWIGTNSSGLYNYNFRSRRLNKIIWDYGSLQQKVNQITGDKYVLYVATEGGLIIYYIENGSTDLLDTESGLAHNAIKTVCIAENSTIWMGTHSRYLYGIRNSTIDEFEITNVGELEVTSIAEGNNGEIWIATAENGVYKKMGNSFARYSTNDGLKSDYTYAIQLDGNGKVWVGHRGGMSRINPDDGKVVVYDHKSGIKEQVNPRAMFLDEKNYLWIGTDGGAIKYDPSKDRKEIVPPVINLLSIMIGEKEYSPDEPINLPYNNYRVEFNFIGISFGAPEKVKYKYKLVGHDQVYSNFTKESLATYGKLADGEYVFQVMACNEDGICSEETASVKITIAKPFWKQLWFFIVVALVLIGTVILIVRLRVKRLQANQIYLEEQLAIKTKEVVEKAEIIQEINKDLTSSINYAERIQAAILPSTEELDDIFPNSFIFYRPRDIVSGDFYFMRHYPDKLIVACVDCTGHGVPGAFMSMIGSTTLRNIYTLMDSTGNWKTPDQVLDVLDEEIQTILHQEFSGSFEDDFFKSRDGMDMTLCEINLKTNELLISSAKRHSIIVQSGSVKIISGDKRPIGGGIVDKVDFHLKSFQMNKGDALFLFSDGYPDQFGGKDGRKMKLLGVQQIIEDLLKEDRKKYGKIITNKFDNWKGNKEQIDDVLMMGILF